MSVSISPDEELASVYPLTQFTRTVTATYTGDDEQNDITLVDAVLEGNQDFITITPGETSVTISGQYADPFLNIFTYVTRGSSDLLETPVSVEGTENLPDAVDWYNLNQDQQLSVTRTFTIKVYLNDNETPAEEFEITQDVLNDYEFVRQFVTNYYGD